ncbi:MAG: hypothetical protein CBC24_05840 [Candidatus Pelagibacter sp. TMED64]|nr:MAG: hypothetical protein CBC24_05840 [Candidatus Pelagibacter sp. TMED64]
MIDPPKMIEGKSERQNKNQRPGALQAEHPAGKQKCPGTQQQPAQNDKGIPVIRLGDPQKGQCQGEKWSLLQLVTEQRHTEPLQ